MQQLAGQDVREASARTAAWRRARRPHAQLARRVARRARRAAARCASRIRFPKVSARSTWATSAPPLSCAVGSSSVRRLVEGDRLAERRRARSPAASAAATGAKMSRPWKVARHRLAGARASGRRRRPPRRRRGARRRASAGRCRGRRAGGRSSRCAARRAPARRRAPTPGSTTARCTPGGHVGQRCRAARARRRARRGAGSPWVRSITRACGQRRAITPWQTPTNSSLEPVVGQERDHGGAQLSRTSFMRAASASDRGDHARRCRDARPRRRARGRARAASRS